MEVGLNLYYITLIKTNGAIGKQLMKSFIADAQGAKYFQLNYIHILF